MSAVQEEGADKMDTEDDRADQTNPVFTMAQCSYCGKHFPSDAGQILLTHILQHIQRMYPRDEPPYKCQVDVRCRRWKDTKDKLADHVFGRHTVATKTQEGTPEHHKALNNKTSAKDDLIMRIARSTNGPPRLANHIRQRVDNQQ